ncbi:MAG: rod shape-determining protein MreC [Pseudohongiellaceae bacterium]
MDKTLFIKGVSLEYRVLSFVLLSVCLMFADSRFGYLDKVRFVLGYFTTPVYWVADTPARISFLIDDVFVSRTDLIEENEDLRGQLLVSQRQLQLLESLVSENNRLRALQDSARAVNGEVLTAEIINVSPDPYSKRVLVNKGARDGVFEGQALLDANGLMGQVVEVLPFTSWILLITDSHHVTPVQVNRNGERALARGSRTTASELELEFVTQTQDIKAGDRLVSSGMGQVYPKNYPVAEVISVYADPGQPFLRVRARPLALIESTRHVMLVFENSDEGFDPAPLGLDPQTQNVAEPPAETASTTQ